MMNLYGNPAYLMTQQWLHFLNLREMPFSFTPIHPHMRPTPYNSLTITDGRKIFTGDFLETFRNSLSEPREHLSEKEKRTYHGLYRTFERFILSVDSAEGLDAALEFLSDRSRERGQEALTKSFLVPLLYLLQSRLDFGPASELNQYLKSALNDKCIVPGLDIIRAFKWAIYDLEPDYRTRSKKNIDLYTSYRSLMIKA